ncbi:Atu4866 domain-containing protein [Phyllobacterium meliloti]|uniref:Atu4866 domain-containing protein n=1 Tax=Phyllobacterium meliloti TaxID=555317 RepID=UPI001D14A38F|nr:Atu4866 domain-containing protein [Phyllobacterium sp. T1293]UGX89320.1 Atu4866 domain-containing protein [Phyllobacterium sp. T1293]
MVAQPSNNAALGLLVAFTTIGAVVMPASGETTNKALQRHQQTSEKTMPEHPYVGLWITDDGHVRHELLPDGRYDEARGVRESAYQGRYEVSGNHIEYWDDTGFTADGDFVDANTLQHGGMILRRK